MIALLQRVSRASVAVDETIIGAIEHGLLIFLGVEKSDSEENADRLLQRVLGYRVFADENDKMNLDVQQVSGGILLVSQFTLVANTQKGTRPSFSSAGSPELGQQLYHYFLTQLQDQHQPVASGEFGADMQVELVNDGPVTFTLQC